MKYIQLIVIICAAFSAGLSSGIGIWPKYNQPKNIRIQLILAFIAVLLISLWFFTLRQYSF